MKNVLKVVVVGILLFSASFAKAQAPKFGHIDLQALIQAMPERADAEKKFNAYQKELEDAYGTMQKEAQTKYVEFLAKRDSLTETVRKIKEDELNSLSERVQTYQQNAQQQLQAKYQELLKPVFDKAEKAVKDVGLEKGLIYVFDVSANVRVVLYNSKESVDLLPFAKTKLGIK